MRILVTGSEGSLMQSVIPKLIEKGHKVIGVDNFYRYGEIKRERNYEFIKGDLTNRGFVDEIVQGMDYIIQGAAILYGVLGFHKYSADILSKDVLLHSNILLAAKLNSVKKVIYISSSMVYERAENVPSLETDVLEMKTPLTDYGLSKLVGERLSKAFFNQYGLKYTIWRPFNIITPHEKAEETGFSHVFADFLDKIIIRKQTPLSIIGDGQQVRCFIWIEDVASAIADYSFDELTDQETFNIGNPQAISMKDLAKKISSKAFEKGIINEKKVEFSSIKAPKDDVRVRVPSIDKITTHLGWVPKISLDEALDICIDNLVSKTESK